MKEHNRFFALKHETVFQMDERLRSEEDIFTKMGFTLNELVTVSNQRGVFICPACAFPGLGDDQAAKK